MTWTELAQGDGFTVPAGQFVAVVASVKSNHSAADLRAFAAKRGFTLSDFAEEGARAGLGPDPRAPDYRYVAAIGQASEDVDLPWEAPWPLSMFDGSQLVRAWLSPTSVPAPSPPTPQAPTQSGGPSMAPLAVIFGVGMLLWWRARPPR